MAKRSTTRTVFTLRIEMDNAAFADNAGAELGRILGTVKRVIERGETVPHFVLDSNGNTVGEWIIAEHRRRG